MTVSYDSAVRGSSQGSMATLEDKFEVLKEIGDGSFGSVVLARVRTAGSYVARRGTMVSMDPGRNSAITYAYVIYRLPSRQ